MIKRVYNSGEREDSTGPVESKPPTWSFVIYGIPDEERHMEHRPAYWDRSIHIHRAFST